MRGSDTSTRKRKFPVWIVNGSYSFCQASPTSSYISRTMRLLFTGATLDDAWSRRCDDLARAIQRLTSIGGPGRTDPVEGIFQYP